MSDTRIIHEKIAVGAPLADEGELTVAVDIFLPKTLASPPVALFCQPW